MVGLVLGLFQGIGEGLAIIHSGVRLRTFDDGNSLGTCTANDENFFAIHDVIS
jgi:hypothetical protein